MEGGSVDAGGENHLENVLSQTEIANIPNPVAVKINNYIDQKFGEYLTSKALHETRKSEIGEYPAFSATHTKLSLVFYAFYSFYINPIWSYIVLWILNFMQLYIVLYVTWIPS